ncbi:MAG: 16S rRNA (guanine(527)-N(7))-methyltransferase RsmG [Cellvibrionaceae bacterium]
MNRENCEKLLTRGLDTIGIDLDAKKINLLLDYLENFHKWNQAYNLSAIREPEKMVSRHLLDSLVLVPYLKNYIEQFLSLDNDEEGKREFRLIDVGTGGGLPGFPLAIMFPNIKVTLLDSNGKKTRFLFQTALKLGLQNITVEHKRVEKFHPEDKFAIVTSRAFASLYDMVNGSRHLLSENGEYWAMKGVYPEAELRDCSQQAELIQAEKLTVPDGLSGETGPDNNKDSDQEERYLIRLKPSL